MTENVKGTHDPTAKSKAGTTMLPSFKLLYNVIVFKTVW